MKSTSILPGEYMEAFSMELQKNKKLALGINALAVVIAVVMAVPAALSVPFETLYQAEELSEYLLRLGCLIGGIFLYMILHELVHGICMKAFGAEKVNYGFTGLYAFAGSETYFAKKYYLIITLAPVAVWGVVLAVLNCLVPMSWFWIVYIIQIINVSGAAGDAYVFCRLIRMPGDTLIYDTGVSMMVYTRR